MSELRGSSGHTSQGPIWMLGVFVAMYFFAVGALGFWHWNLAAGVMLTAMLFSSPIRWPWIALGAGFAFTASSWFYVRDPAVEAFAPVLDLELLGCASCVKYFIGHWADPLLCMLPAWWLRQRLEQPKDLTTPDGMALVHLVVLCAALLQTATDILWVLGDGFVGDVRHGQLVDSVGIRSDNAAELLGAFAMKNALGYFLGTMLLIPLVLWWNVPGLRKNSTPMLREVGLLMFPLSVAFLILLRVFPDTHLAELLRLLLIIAVVIFAARHGLRGAAFSVLLVSVVLAIEDHLWGASRSPIWLQSFVAIAGAMALMFGASMDQIRRQANELIAAQEKERRMLAELKEAAARNVRVEETERGRLSMELHDSLGQGITAMHTQLRLIDLDSGPDVQRWTSSLRELVQQMRNSLREVLEALRPSALVELGLVKAINQGSIRRAAEAAGVQFELHVYPSGSSLNNFDDAVSVAVYRIVQEGVTNAIRHAQAREVVVRLRKARRNHQTWLIVSIRDDGRGGDVDSPGQGLRGARDRAITLGGGARVRCLRRSGFELRAWFVVEDQPGGVTTASSTLQCNTPIHPS